MSKREREGRERIFRERRGDGEEIEETFSFIGAE